MAVLSRSLGYLFIMAPRTGCTAVGDLLCKQVEGWWFPEQDVTDENGTVMAPRKHTTVNDLLDAGLLEAEELRDLFVFTSVRNPFDSLVSLYVKKRTSYQPLLDDPDSFIHQEPGFTDDMEFVLNHTFSEWIEHQYGDLVGDDQPRHLYSSYLRGADHVMRFEHLQEDLDEVLEHLGVEPIEIPILNPTEAREEEDYRSYYTDEARAIVSDVFEADLERFGYRFEDPSRVEIRREDRGVGDIDDDPPTHEQSLRQDPDNLPAPERADARDAPSLTIEAPEGVTLYCPACQQQVEGWAPGPGNRPNARCPHCHALERHRFLAYLLDRLAPVISSARHVVDVAPQRQIRRLLTHDLRLGAAYVGTDLAAHGVVDVRADVTRLPFRGGSVEVMVCYHVLEHVPDDRSAMEEISRVLAPGGFALVQSPRRRGMTTDEDPTASVEERIARFGQADHVRYYGDDLESRLAAHGLRPTVLRTTEMLDDLTIARHGLDPNEEVWLCKPMRPASRDGAPPPDIMSELEIQRDRAARATERAEYWERQYRRVREHPLVRALAPLRRAGRELVDRIRD